MVGPMNQISNRIKLVILTGGLLAFGLFLKLADLRVVFSLENLKSHHDALMLLVAHHNLLSILIYFGIYVLIVSLTLPFTAVAMIAGGALFGFWEGLGIILLGSVIGSTISFLIMRYFLKRTISTRINQSLARFDQDLKRHGASYLLGLHLVGVTPFFVINGLAALANVNLLTFLWTTALGIMPISVLFAYMGSTIGSFNSVNDIFTLPVLILLLIMGMIAILPVMVSKYRDRKAQALKKAGPKNYPPFEV